MIVVYKYYVLCTTYHPIKFLGKDYDQVDQIIEALKFRDLKAIDIFSKLNPDVCYRGEDKLKGVLVTDTYEF